MSAYGPALFVSRKDGAPLSAAERETVLELVRAAAKRLRLKNDDREPVDPRVYD